MIAQILKSAPKYQADNLALYCQARTDTPSADYAAVFMISHSAGNAVVRNQIRRWLREDLRLLQRASPRGGDFIIRFFGSGHDVDHSGLGRILEQLYSQIGQDVTQ